MIVYVGVTKVNKEGSHLLGEKPKLFRAKFNMSNQARGACLRP